ncbi:DUF5069 domain-containing protein [Vampirovibrio sp.]|uniref:DUF5069 domain-containing protein n=1 Tax=Vampirovibrio sp. TaxID=2717857 RepID=UPI0035933E7F
MTTTIESTSLKTLAKDLSQEPPRSPRDTLAGYVIAARILDKCRAFLNGTAGEYDFDCYLDNVFFGFTGIKADDFKAFVATGASDEAVAEWITQHAKPMERLELVKWNNHLRYANIKEMEDSFQLFMEDYIEKNVPKHRPIYHAFDIFDLEEGRL